MRRVKLDRIDKKILNKLQDEGRITNVELSQYAGISAPPCLRRVRALEDGGYIKSYHADLNADLLGYSVTVFAKVALSSHTDGDLKRFEDLVNSWPMVRESYMLAGDSDFMLKIVAPSWDIYQHFLIEHITKAPNVEQVKSTLTVRSTKNKPGIPVDENNI